MSELPELWDPEDYAYRRRRIYEEAQKAAEHSLNREYGNVRLEVDDLRYEGPETISPTQERNLLFKGGFAARRLKGRMRLYDKETGELLDERDETLMRVPILTDSGTFIHNGNDYTSAMQARLIPGVYPRHRNNGQLEAHFNVKRASGSPFRLTLDPESTIYKMEMGGNTFRLYPILRRLGVSDDILKHKWGEHVWQANRSQDDTKDWDKAYRKFAGRDYDPEADDTKKADTIRAALGRSLVNREAVSISLPQHKPDSSIGYTIGEQLLNL